MAALVVAVLLTQSLLMGSNKPPLQYSMPPYQPGWLKSQMMPVLRVLSNGFW
jgi:hypothetical protein